MRPRWTTRTSRTCPRFSDDRRFKLPARWLARALFEAPWKCWLREILLSTSGCLFAAPPNELGPRFAREFQSKSRSHLAIGFPIFHVILCRILAWVEHCFCFFSRTHQMSTVDVFTWGLCSNSRSSEYGSLSRQLYATDVSTGKTVALACTPPGTGADGACCPIFQANRGPKYWANWKFDSFRLLKGTDWRASRTGGLMDTCCDPSDPSTVKHDADRWGKRALPWREAAQRASTTDEHRHFQKWLRNPLKKVLVGIAEWIISCHIISSCQHVGWCII